MVAISYGEKRVILLVLRGRFSDLLNRELRRTTLLLWFIWTGCSFIYYGVVLISTELFETPGDNVCSLDGSIDQVYKSFVQC